MRVPPEVQSCGRMSYIGVVSAIFTALSGAVWFVALHRRVFFGVIIHSWVQCVVYSRGLYSSRRSWRSAAWRGGGGDVVLSGAVRAYVMNACSHGGVEMVVMAVRR